MNIKLKHVTFNDLIEDIKEYTLFWSNGTKEYKSIIFSMPSGNILINSTKRKRNGVYCSTKISNQDKIEKHIKKEIFPLIMEDDYYNAKAFYEIRHLNDEDKLKEWIKEYEYENEFIAIKRMSECKYLHNDIINKYHSFQNYETMIMDKEII